MLNFYTVHKNRVLKYQELRSELNASNLFFGFFSLSSLPFIFLGVTIGFEPVLPLEQLNVTTGIVEEVGLQKRPGRGRGMINVVKIRQLDGYQKTFKLPLKNTDLFYTLVRSSGSEVSIYWNYWILNWSPIPLFHTMETALEIRLEGEPLLVYKYDSHLKVNGAEYFFRIMALVGLGFFSYLNIRPWTMSNNSLNK